MSRYKKRINSMEHSHTCNSNDLAINPSKTIQVNFSRKKDPIPNILDISTKNSVTFLGVVLDNKLTWTEHVDNLCKRISTGIYALRRIKWVSDLEAAKTTYHALVESHLRYGIAVWGGSSANNNNRLLLLQKKAIRILAELGPQESCRQAFKTLGILTVTSLYILHIILYVDKLNLQTNEDYHKYNTRNSKNYVLPIHRTTLYGKSPSYNGRKLWNILPTPIKQLKGAALKKRLHDFLVSRPTYTLEEFITAREDDLRRSHVH
ncbi:hypothetical protein J6590_108518 [Homalodisca vitripennis]|nr:hypothetical protein J6590_108734 [Homalodisca vitripennis]KAG8321748.1 hypothetical protein J6590_108518 [Homalodisca vitripennis]